MGGFVATVGWLIFIGVGVVIGWIATHISLEDRESDVRHRESIVEARLNALDAASRINLAHWRAAQALRAEAERHDQDQP